MSNFYRKNPSNATAFCREISKTCRAWQYQTVAIMVHSFFFSTIVQTWFGAKSASLFHWLAAVRSIESMTRILFFAQWIFQTVASWEKIWTKYFNNFSQRFTLGLGHVIFQNKTLQKALTRVSFHTLAEDLLGGKDWQRLTSWEMQ